MNKKITLSIVASLMAVCGHAQPIVTSSIVFPAVGTIDSVFMASATVPPGAGGAGVTWNLNALSFTFGGKLEIVDPASTPYTSTFSTSNFGFKITTSGTTYNYNRKSATGIENLSTNYAGVGTGTDYTPNPRLSTPIPFHYGDSVADAYQGLGSSAEAVGLKYDGYGTLMVGGKIYNNVIRVLEDYGGGDYHYAWYQLSPFMLVLNYSSTGNNYVFISQAVGVNGVHEVNEGTAQVVVQPNPFVNDCHVVISGVRQFSEASVAIMDVTGRIVKQAPIAGAETVISREGLIAGIYLYRVQNEGRVVASGKVVIE